MTRYLLALGGCLALTACSSYRTEGEIPACIEADEGVDYPSCPYGTTVGDVVANATFEGYASHDRVGEGLQTVSFADFYDPDGEGPRLLFVNAGAVWCAPCKEEARELPHIWERLGDKVAFIAVVYEGMPNVVATEKELASWVKSFKTPFFTVMDPEGQILAYFDKSSPPYSMVIDTKTMRIVGQVVGKPDDLEAFIASHL